MIKPIGVTVCVLAAIALGRPGRSTGDKLKALAIPGLSH
jgi:hypothetical protein